jgi:Rps23 Pro-64 3,4-dihydroxylase Tpa1-like proline 4-hydroxylase
MNTFIYENDYSIPELLCDEIMYKYKENSLHHYQGVTHGGIQKNIKDTKDFLIPKCKNEKDEWYKIEMFLCKELQSNFEKYKKKINNVNEYFPENNNNILHKLLNDDQHIDNFMIQKYEKNIGKYTYHHDFHCDIEKKRYRTVTYLWYLNDVTEGGETEFWGSYQIKPKKGKLILFPSSWCFPHRGKMPISSDKYIITGWFYKMSE